ncbi:hypothetical protein BJ875DRAFT_384774 [Amylocarpus encephaloides]|uniref:Uncharacterized protein n=1 Tax=Amylocarpus encephaloides TaxID=45428 RepID=A0A9P7YBW7_9HELO|nr:hypothetical protein BJ875DRAFT_384774 [Amylocarpus encephaloides]
MLLKLRTQPFSTSKDNTLPPRMFITPDLTSNGNDTPGRTFASNLTHLEPLLVDKTFMQNTLVLIPFDENETYSIENKVFGILLGDAVPKHLVGTSNNSFYNHDSEISTVSANWYRVSSLSTAGMPVPASKVFSNVASYTGDHIRKWEGKMYYDNFS